MGPRVRVLLEAKQLILSRLVRLANQEELAVIWEAQRTAVICKRLVEEGLVTLPECEALHRGCSRSEGGILEPKAGDAETFEANILRRLQAPKPLDDITLQIVRKALSSATRLFVEHGMLMQIGLNQRIVDHGVPMSVKKLNGLGRLMGRIDKEHWRTTLAESGRGELVATSMSIKKLLRAKHVSAKRLGQQDDHD